MNILVLSDSHGNISNMEEAVEREKPDMILHLGDCWRDAERLAERYPDILMEHVPGNCDCRPEEPAEKLLFLGDCRVLICHGHTCGVKTSLLTAGLKAEQDHLDAFLFGHTHKPHLEYCEDGLVVLNPGSLSYPRQDGRKPSYMLMEIDRNGEAHYTVCYVDQDRDIPSGLY